MSKIKKNDNVKIITGKDKGKTGKVLKVSADKILVEGVNIATIHKKPTGQSAGQVVKEERPINISNVAYLEGDKPIKVGYQIENGKKVRISRKSKNKIG